MENFVFLRQTNDFQVFQLSDSGFAESETLQVKDPVGFVTFSAGPALALDFAVEAILGHFPLAGRRLVSDEEVVLCQWDGSGT